MGVISTDPLPMQNGANCFHSGMPRNPPAKYKGVQRDQWLAGWDTAKENRKKATQEADKRYRNMLYNYPLR